MGIIAALVIMKTLEQQRVLDAWEEIKPMLLEYRKDSLGNLHLEYQIAQRLLRVIARA